MQRLCSTRNAKGLKKKKKEKEKKRKEKEENKRKVYLNKSNDKQIDVCLREILIEICRTDGHSSLLYLASLLCLRSLC